MKKYSLLIIMVLISCTVLFGQKDQSEVISFYKVPLVCGAAPDIGCGSRAKPALLAMEQSQAISEAWLNRAGTVYAVVWKEKDMTQKVARPIFKKHSILYERMSSSESAEMHASFRQERKWLRGADVDQLSIEEAGRIAEGTTGFLLEKKEISEAEYGK